MKKISYSLMVFTAMLLFGCSASQSKKKNFVTVDGMQFKLNNKPYYFTGANIWYACYLGAVPDGRERLVKELDTLKSLGITNLRILGGSEESDLIVSLKPAIQKSPGVYDESLLEGLDFALAEMGKRNMHAVIYLNNYWQWSGGMSQYVNWITGEKIPDPDAPEHDWSSYMKFSARFYTIPEAVKLYNNYIKTIVDRTNKLTGVKYKDDETIMAWELANEPRPSEDTADSDIIDFIKWVDETAGYIQSMDKNHLVTTGTEGTVGCLRNAEYFLLVHQTKNIDYVNLHLWPKNWGWFDTYDIEKTYPVAEKNAVEYINLHLDLARRLNKPITMEEFGLDRDNGNTLPGSPAKTRDRFFKKVFELVYDSAKNKAPIAGTNIWAWGGFAVPRPVNEVMSDPGAFLGDQLGEAQGLNSVFINDSSTVQIIADHAKKMNGLNK